MYNAGHELSQPSTVTLEFLFNSTNPFLTHGFPDLPIPIDATQRLADKLKQLHPEKAEDLIGEMSESANSIYM